MSDAVVRVQMTVAPYKRGNLIGSGPNHVDVEGDDGHDYMVALDGVAILPDRGRVNERRFDKAPPILYGVEDVI